MKKKLTQIISTITHLFENRILIIKHSSILLLFFLFDFWFTNFSGLNIGKLLTFYYPIDENEISKPINFYNLFLAIGIIFLLFKAIKEYNLIFPKSKILNCTIFGFFVFLITELIFQIVVQIFICKGSIEIKFLFYIKRLLFTSILGGFISFLISYKIIANKKWHLIILTLIFLKAFNMLIEYFPNLLEQNF